MAITHKDLNDLQFPRMLHKDGREVMAQTPADAVSMLNTQGFTLRPTPPPMPPKRPGHVGDSDTPAVDDPKVNLPAPVGRNKANA